MLYNTKKIYNKYFYLDTLFYKFATFYRYK